MSNRPRCTAPIRGHRGGSAAHCPVHCHGGAPTPAGVVTKPPTGRPVLGPDMTLRRRVNAAKNLRTTPAVLAALAEDEDDIVRRGVAQNLSTPTDVLVVLADDEAARRVVALNPNTPVDVLVVLATATSSSCLLYTSDAADE